MKESTIRDRLLAIGLVGSEYDRDGKRRATREVAAVSAPGFDILRFYFISPWNIDLGDIHSDQRRKYKLPTHPALLRKKILIHNEFDHRDRAKDLLSIYTIEAFSEHLGELREIYAKDIRTPLHSKSVAELREAADGLFGNVNGTIREAVLTSSGKKAEF